jgi:glutamate synthase (NADPH/NADH) small chain
LIGSGPASIAAAGWLALEGHECVIFERKEVPGGLGALGIAPWRVKEADALRELDWVLSLGQIELRTGVELVAGGSGKGRISADDLLRDYDAVFLGLGLAGKDRLGLEGEEGPGVHQATSLIEKIKSQPGFTLEGARKAVVLGDGRAAMDVARELAQLHLDVSLVTGRSSLERNEARNEGVRILENRHPAAIVRQAGRVIAVQISSGDTLPADIVVVAPVESPHADVAVAFPGVKLDARRRVVVDPSTHRTGNPKVWSAGDCVNGGQAVVHAVAGARSAVMDIQRSFEASAWAGDAEPAWQFP